jgi:hydrogenase maturation protease
MLRTIIIGYGNPLRGDDALGYHAARKLSQLVNTKNVVIRTCHQLTPELAEEISTFDLAVFIDASVGDVPGTLSVAQIDSAKIPNRTFSHQLDAESILACSKALYGHVPISYLVTVTANSFEYMEDLSVPVRTRLPDLTDAVLRIVGAEPAIQS